MIILSHRNTLHYPFLDDAIILDAINVCTEDIIIPKGSDVVEACPFLIRMERLFSVFKIQLEKQCRTWLIIPGPVRLLLGREWLSVMDVREWWGRR